MISLKHYYRKANNGSLVVEGRAMVSVISHRLGGCSFIRSCSPRFANPALRFVLLGNPDPELLTAL